MNASPLGGEGRGEGCLEREPTVPLIPPPSLPRGLRCAPGCRSMGNPMRVEAPKGTRKFRLRETTSGSSGTSACGKFSAAATARSGRIRLRRSGERQGVADALVPGGPFCCASTGKPGSLKLASRFRASSERQQAITSDRGAAVVPTGSAWSGLCDGGRGAGLWDGL